VQDYYAYIGPIESASKTKVNRGGLESRKRCSKIAGAQIDSSKSGIVIGSAQSSIQGRSATPGADPGRTGARIEDRIALPAPYFEAEVSFAVRINSHANLAVAEQLDRYWFGQRGAILHCHFAKKENRLLDPALLILPAVYARLGRFGRSRRFAGGGRRLRLWLLGLCLRP